MKKYRGKIIFTVLCLLFIGTLLIYAVRMDVPAGEQRQVRVAVVLYGTSAERWGALDQGIAQACAELNIEKPVLTVRATPAADASVEMIERIRREVANGADGLLVAACDSSALQAELEAQAQSLPVVMVETGAGETLPCVRADNRQMGRELAARLAAEGRSVGLLPSALERDSVAQRYEGFVEMARDTGLAYTVEPGPNEQPMNVTLAKLHRRGVDTCVVLDNETLEQAVAVADGLSVSLVGVGASDRVVYDLDRGALEAVCYQNEFSIGYIAMMRLAGKMGLGGENPPDYIEYRIVSRADMYEPATERMLFPVIQ